MNRPTPGMHGGCGCGQSHWRVYARLCNYSAFNGYHQTPSEYSGLVCNNCAHTWRTKAGYVVRIPDITEAERTDWHQGKFALGRELANQKQH